MYRIYRQLPNIITLLNLFFGCCAVVFFLQSGELFIAATPFEERLIRLPAQIWWGCLFIGLALICDFLDGFIARLLRVSTSLGKELDSLADVVSFGVAPSMIVYLLLRLSLMHSLDGIDRNWFLTAPAFLIACGAAYRLARFNLDQRQGLHFIGMPTPAVTFLLCVLPFLYWFDYFGINSFLLNQWVLYALVAFLFYLMNCKLYFFSFKLRKGGIKKNKLLIGFILFSLLSLLLLAWLGLLVSWLLYVGLSYVLQKQLKEENERYSS